MSRYPPDRAISTLALALSEHMQADELKELIKFAGRKPPTRKAELVAEVLSHLAGDRLRAVWESLDDVQKAAVAEVVHSADTTFYGRRFEAKYGRSPVFGSVSRYERDGKPTSLLFFFYGSGGYYVMPDDLKERLLAFVPPPAADTIDLLDKLPSMEDGLTIRERERSAQKELQAVLRLVDAGKIAVSETTRRASSASIDSITAVLDQGDYYPFAPPKDKWSDDNVGPILAFAWPLLLQAGGLAQPLGTKLQLTKSGRKSLTDPIATTMKSLWKTWRQTTLLDELARIDCVKGQTGKGKRGLTAVASRREVIANVLAECPVGRWVSPDELYRHLSASDQEFTITRNPRDLYIGDAQYGSLGSGEDPGILELRYVLCVLFEYAATLGLIDIAFVGPAGSRNDYRSLWGADGLSYVSRYDGLKFLRVTALGAYCLESVREYQPVAEDRLPVLAVRPDRTIHARYADLDPADRLALDAYAVRTSEAAWRMEEPKLLSAIEEGRTLEEMIEFLETAGGETLPTAVASWLATVGERCNQLRDQGLARLIECSQPELADVLAANPKTRRHCLRAGDRHLVVPASAETAFRHALKELGYLLAAGAPRTVGARRGGKGCLGDADASSEG